MQPLDQSGCVPTTSSSALRPLGTNVALCAIKYSRINFRTICEGVTSCWAHKLSKAFFLAGSIKTVSRAVLSSMAQILCELNANLMLILLSDLKNIEGRTC